MPIRHPLAIAIAALLFTAASAAQPAVTFNQENMRLRSASVTGGPSTWNIGLVMEADNANPNLSLGFRRWWHCQIANLSPFQTLNIAVSNAGYSDAIRPAWSFSTDGGATFGAWTRVPTTPTRTGGGPWTHSFTVTVPANVDAIRLAKWYPYTVADKDAWLASIAGDPRLRSVTVIGNSNQGRPLQMLEFTEPTIPDAGKKRIWIHAGIHPSENTGYFMVEGLVDLLLSSDPDSFNLLGNSIINIIPMANPDGVVLGNYRTNSFSDNIENNWFAPYTNSEASIAAMRAQIEQFMGTAASPGANPIEVVLNLHATHNVTYPFHFRHTSNPNFDIVTNRSGVIPEVHDLEQDWIDAFDAQSPLMDLGTTSNSSCGATASPSRPFVECMMHDRWTIDPAWPGEPVMSITMEGTYTLGPNGGAWATQDDYRDVGREMGRALIDYFGFTPPSTDLFATASSFGVGCNGAIAFGGVDHQGPTTNVLDLTLFGATPGSGGILLIGLGQDMFPLPPPWNCGILNFVASAPVTITQPLTEISFLLPNDSGMVLDMQFLTAIAAGPGIAVQTSNGIEVANQF